MAIARLYGFEIDFVGNPISGSAAWFFIIISKFITTPIFEIKIYEKNSLAPKKFIFEARFDSTSMLIWRHYYLFKSSAMCEKLKIGLQKEFS